jgi:single-stranded DNA-binding protein
MKKLYDAVATIGKYTDKQGNEKKRYVTVGSVFGDDQGRMSLKLDAVPCSPEWSGWISFYEPKQYDGPPQRQQSPTQHQQAKANAYQRQPVDMPDGDDIPF